MPYLGPAFEMACGFKVDFFVDSLSDLSFIIIDRRFIGKGILPDFTSFRGKSLFQRGYDNDLPRAGEVY